MNRLIYMATIGILFPLPVLGGEEAATAGVGGVVKGSTASATSAAIESSTINPDLWCNPKPLRARSEGSPVQYIAKIKNFKLIFLNPNVAKGQFESAGGGFDIVDVRNGHRCHASDGISGPIFVSKDETKIIEMAGSGSASWTTTFDPNDCTPIDSVNGTAETIHRNNVIIEPRCQGDGTDARCDCDPGGVYDLLSDCRFHRLPEQSDAQTKKKTGVIFSKRSYVAYPGTPRAKLLGDYEEKGL